ncbi:MAG: hypothetical protein V4549_08505 [Bacteroidota bacterium]
MKYRIAFFLIAFFFSLASIALGQINVIKLDPSKLPKGIYVQGEIENAVRYTDKLGDNIVITTETGQYPSKKVNEEDDKDAELFAYHFLSHSDTIKQTWKVYDFIKACPFDIEANFVKNTFEVTDLNNDGIAEVWLVYKTTCHSDVSPSDMKIIMYQGSQKFAMRGRNKVKISDTEFEGGEYAFDKVFTDGSIVFRDFAKKLWDKNIM